VSVDAEAWRRIDAALADLPYRIAAPLVSAIQQTGGVQEAPELSSNNDPNGPDS
jgi:hypothetical protein